MRHVLWLLLLAACGPQSRPEPAAGARPEGLTEIEVHRAPSGAIRETEVEVPVDSLPAAVAAAVAGKGRLAEAEVVLTADGVEFEVEVRGDDGKETEYTIAADGTLLGAGGDDGDEGADDRDEDDDD